MDIKLPPDQLAAIIRLAQAIERLAQACESYTKPSEPIAYEQALYQSRINAIAGQAKETK